MYAQSLLKLNGIDFKSHRLTIEEALLKPKRAESSPSDKKKATIINYQAPIKGISVIPGEKSCSKGPSFFFYRSFLSRPFTDHRTAGEGRRGISLTSHYPFHPLHRYLDISRAITTETSSLYIGSIHTRTRSLCFPSASH